MKIAILKFTVANFSNTLDFFTVRVYKLRDKGTDFDFLKALKHMLKFLRTNKHIVMSVIVTKMVAVKLQFNPPASTLSYSCSFVYLISLLVFLGIL